MPWNPAISALIGRASHNLISAVSLVVFTFLDVLDIVFCVLYRVLDAVFEENSIPCYCGNSDNGIGEVGEAQVSETLYQRRNLFRDLGFLKLGKNGKKKPGSTARKARWSDCNCESCGSWQQIQDQKLHLVLFKPSQGSSGEADENVILLHGFLASSSFWVETVFPNLSETGKQMYRLFAVDLFGFGRSPKPWDSLYTLKDHVEMVEKSVIAPFHLTTFHVVAHSMGCIIGLAVAAKYPNSVKSITLVAPPYFPSSEEKASLSVLNRVGERRVWPPILFGSSFMSWYEHLGRSVCFIICKNHRRWEWILKLLSRKRDVHFMIKDMTKHTHHSAFHTMHNVICGGAKLMDAYLEGIKKSGVMLTVIQGDKDELVPLECSYNVKSKVPLAEVRTIPNANHSTVILGREQQFTTDLENIWCSALKKHHHYKIV